MTDGFDQALANAGLTLLTADASLIVFDGYVPANTVRPYVLVYTSIEWPFSVAMDDLSGSAFSPTVRWYCHCVGDTEKAARAVAQRTRTQLLNVRPTITGLNVGIIRYESGTPPTRDESTGAPVFDAVNTYVLQATS